MQDLARTFPGNAWVCTGEGQAALRRVLLAFSAQNPRVGYCQSMNFLAAALLLVLDRAEERAFWVLVCLIDDGGVCPSHDQRPASDAVVCLVMTEVHAPHTLAPFLRWEPKTSLWTSTLRTSCPRPIRGPASYCQAWSEALSESHCSSQCLSVYAKLQTAESTGSPPPCLLG